MNVHHQFVLVIPLPSVVSKQFRRSLFIADGWRQKLGDESPSNFGWVDTNCAGEEPCWVVDIQDVDDPYYSKPLEIVKGCSCKNKDKKCEKCNCKKLDSRAKKCTPLTCRFCGCFDREQTDDGNLSSSSTEFSSDTESDSMSEPLINYQRDIISKDHDDVSSDESDQMI